MKSIAPLVVTALTVASMAYLDVAVLADDAAIVNLGKERGPTCYRASGFLFGFNSDGPPDNMVVPLKIQLNRSPCELVWSEGKRLEKLGIKQQLIISDSWGYTGPWPGDNGDWAKWEQFVVNIVEQTRQRGLNPQWDIWNEPDKPRFWNRPPEQFRETWRRAWLKIRETDPTAVIVGPSWAQVWPGKAQFNEFLSYCKDENVVPDYVSWHCLNSTNRNVIQEAQDCRSLLSAMGLNDVRIQINEYCAPAEQYAGKTAWWIAQIERTEVDAACHAIWSADYIGRLDGIITPSYEPTGQWWVYQRYAAITGRLVETTPGKSIDLVAGRDEQTGAVRVLLGNSGKVAGSLGNVLVAFQGVHKAVEGASVHVLVEMIPEASGEVVSNPQVILDQQVSVSNNALDVTIPWTSDRDAYTVTLTGLKVP